MKQNINVINSVINSIRSNINVIETILADTNQGYGIFLIKKEKKVV